MAAPAITYTFTNGTTADADQVNRNFTDIVNGLTNGATGFDLTVNNITAAGTIGLTGTVSITGLELQDTSADHQYVFVMSELAADRNITLPVLDQADEFVFKTQAVTMSNKTFVAPVLGTPGSGNLSNCTALPHTSITGLDAGIADWLATASSANLRTAMTDESGTGSLVFATSPTLVTPLLGTPTSGTLTNCTGLPTAGISDLGSGIATFLTTPTDANFLATGITGEGSGGNVVFSTSPTLTTPNIGVATATSVNKVAITAPATAATLTIADGKTISASGDMTISHDLITSGGHSLTFTTNGATNVTLPTTGTLAANSAATEDVAGIVTTFVPVVKSSDHAVSSANYTVLDDDGYDKIIVTTGASDRTMTLPTASANSGRKITFVKKDSGAGDVIIDGEGVETINNPGTTITLTEQYSEATVICDGTEWYGVGQATPTIPGLVSSFVPVAKSAVNNVSAAYAMTTTDGYSTVNVTTSTSNYTITLPDEAENAGREITIRKADSGSGNARPADSGGIITEIATEGCYIRYISDGTTWIPIATNDYVDASYNTVTLSADNTDTNIESISLEIGTWKITADFEFNMASNGDNAQVACYLGVNSPGTAGTLGLDLTYGLVGTGSRGSTSITRIMTLAAADIIYANANSDCGASAAHQVTAGITAIRLI